MVNENLINEIKEKSKKLALFNKEGGNIWTEEYIARQMLEAHLNPEFDGASRRSSIIEQTVDFLDKKILRRESSILDLGCGPGLYAEKLCRKGHKVTGIDFSENTICYAKENAKRENLNIDYKCEDFFNLKYSEEYDAVIQSYGEINTFSDEERDRLLKLIYRALKQNGRFIFDISTPILRKNCSLKKNWYISEEGFWRGKAHIVLEEGFQYENNIWLDQYIVGDDEGIQVYRNWFHDYTAETISEIVQKSGFTIVDMVTLAGNPLKTESEWILIIAEKRV
ncbi:methyltransferase domain-containing protein [Clostridium sp. C2-6-12]|uniref:class I SAM-dependent methyltransferase n=1 Tax=Clostridium sp. C2-6-12 TaxID=2698832 RepID=UPI00136A1BA9|nr:methyltransferase domain-containing protein [Clostridium sp. C2-6-12]